MLPSYPGKTENDLHKITPQDSSVRKNYTVKENTRHKTYTAPHHEISK